jgi:hypothetical protein
MCDAVPSVPHTPSDSLEEKKILLKFFVTLFYRKGDTSSNLVTFIQGQFFENLQEY